MELKILYYIKPNKEYYNQIIQQAKEHLGGVLYKYSTESTKAPLIEDNKGKSKIQIPKPL